MPVELAVAVLKMDMAEQRAGLAHPLVGGRAANAVRDQCMACIQAHAHRLGVERAHHSQQRGRVAILNIFDHQGAAGLLSQRHDRL